MTSRTGFAVAVAFAATPSFLAAQTPLEPREAMLSGLTACRQVGDPTQRLACLEAAVSALEQAVAQRNLVVLDREAVKKTQRSLFGFNLPKLAFFGPDDNTQQEVEIVSTIKSARSLGYRKWQITLEDGAIWKTTEPSNNLRDPSPNLPVRIRRGILGGYIMNIDGQRAVHALRQS